MSPFLRPQVLSALLFTALVAGSASAQETTRAVELSLDSLLNTRISAASKYAQTTAEAPASVTILTSDEIRHYGHRNLLDVLESVRGFYVSNDHNYQYLGTRGFGRPTDYNNRILLLVDGHTVNERIWGGAPVGSDLPINFDAVERIEIVRGPGSVLYGTSAMFAVVNIVTKRGTDLDGLRIGVRGGTGRQREASFAGGKALGARGSFAISGIMTRSDGRDFYFPELDDPETNFGVAHGVDWEKTAGGLASLEWNDVSARVGFRSRTKAVPTGSFDALFNDPRTQTYDASLWGELSARRDFGGSYQLTGRVYGDHYDYDGVYAYTEQRPYTDLGRGRSFGGEAMLVWVPRSWARLTVGSELQRILRASYLERQGGDDYSEAGDDAPFDVASVYVQNELQLSSRFTLVSGARVDQKSDKPSALTPRLALITNLDRATTLKLLAGQAFRTPSPAESDLSTDLYRENPSLSPERITTLELEVQRRVSAPVLFGASLYHYRIRNLIDQLSLEDDSYLEYHNVAAARAYGAELQLDVIPTAPVAAHATYSWQHATDVTTGRVLTNSPARTGTISITTNGAGVRSALQLRHESGRQTLVGTPTPAFTRADMNLGYAPFESHASNRWIAGGEISLRVTNLFAERYFAPAGLEHRQTSLEQEGRTFSVRLDWRF
jgi:outer membrane receptor protein involved in Fe transport